MISRKSSIIISKNTDALNVFIYFINYEPIIRKSPIYSIPQADIVKAMKIQYSKASYSTLLSV
jgi:hypothetical protein